MVAEYTGGTITRYRAEYFHQDHLGNTRLVFSDFNQNGIVDLEEDDPATPLNELEITQESHYYPFGMNHLGPWYETVAPENKYLYNGKELSADYEINLYEYGARWYDPAVGRFTGVDPIAEEFPHLSVYNYASNDPIKNIDLHGLQGVPNYIVGEIKSRIENAAKGTIENIRSAPQKLQQAGNWLYNQIIGNDDVSNVVSGTELATEGRTGDFIEAANKGSKVLGPLLDVAEGAKIMVETDTDDSESKVKGTQDAAKLGVEIGIGVIAPVATIPANILIQTSRDGDVVTSPENIERAAGSFEHSINANRAVIERMKEVNGRSDNKRKENP